MRIVAGEFGGRRLSRPKDARVRPTADRVREAWMSILADAIPGARVLDLYAGSGALGLEALSRGAASATFVELNPPSLQALQANVAALGVADRSTVHRGDALRYVERLAGRRIRRRAGRSPLRPGRRRATGGTLPLDPIRPHSFRRAQRRRAAGRGQHPPVRRHRPHLLPRPMTRTAIYPGSFDPLTKGHEDLIRRSLSLADRVVVAVAVNPSKQPLFPVAERLALLQAAVGDDPRVAFESFDGLLAEFAKKVGASIVVRGLRAVSDFEYEFQMALMNRQLHPSLETVFLVPAVDLTYLSSSLVREVARYGGDVSALVHPAVAAALARRYRPMSFRQALRERAAKLRKRIVLCEGDDARVRAAAERIRAERIAEPIVLGGDGIRPGTIRAWRASRSFSATAGPTGSWTASTRSTWPRCRSTSARRWWRWARPTRRWPAPSARRGTRSGRRSGPSAPRPAWTS